MQRGDTCCPLVSFAVPYLCITVTDSRAMQRGDTALHCACREKKLEVAKWLLEQMNSEAALALNKVRDSLL